MRAKELVSEIEEVSQQTGDINSYAYLLKSTVMGLPLYEVSVGKIKHLFVANSTHTQILALVNLKGISGTTWQAKNAFLHSSQIGKKLVPAIYALVLNAGATIQSDIQQTAEGRHVWEVSLPKISNIVIDILDLTTNTLYKKGQIDPYDGNHQLVWVAHV
jgi:hypothetical protein